jgi:hypothetical protein
MLGFPASIPARLVLGLAFIAGTGAMVWAIERPRAAAVERSMVLEASHAAVAKVDVQLVIESTYRVEAWTIQVLGVDQPATHSDQISWSGTVSLAPDDEVFIQAAARPEPPEHGIVPPRGLRIRLGSAPDRFIWGSGDVTATAGITP